MYSAFDSFLNVDTWHSGHPNDLARFNQSLHKVVEKSGFDADAMGEYFRTRLNIDDKHPLVEAVDKYVASAWSVREYLSRSGNLDRDVDGGTF